MRLIEGGCTFGNFLFLTSSDGEGLPQLFLELDDDSYNEQHAINDVDFDSVEKGILEIMHGPETPVFDSIEPVWMDE